MTKKVFKKLSRSRVNDILKDARPWTIILRFIKSWKIPQEILLRSALGSAIFFGSQIVITDAFDKHLRIKINDKNFEWRFDYSLIIFKF